MKKYKFDFEELFLNILGIFIVFLIGFSIFCCFYFGNSNHHMSDRDAEEIIMGTVVF